MFGFPPSAELGVAMESNPVSPGLTEDHDG